MGLFDECDGGGLLGFEPCWNSENCLRKGKLCGVNGGEDFF